MVDSWLLFSYELKLTGESFNGIPSSNATNVPVIELSSTATGHPIKSFTCSPGIVPLTDCTK